MAGCSDMKSLEQNGANPAMLIVFEGPDEMGKSTIARMLVSRLRAEGRSVAYVAFPGNQRGTLGRIVYRLHHDGSSLGLMRPIGATSKQTLHTAAHLDAIERDILPRLRRGTSVVMDRFWWSTWVYGIAAGIDQKVLDNLVAVEASVWASTLPDAMFLVQRETNLEAETTILWRWYQRLAGRESSRYPVHRLLNETTVREAVDRALARLPRAGIKRCRVLE